MENRMDELTAIRRLKVGDFGRRLDRTAGFSRNQMEYA
jgi:hypothetical protein